jgi:hypothetical protein
MPVHPGLVIGDQCVDPLVFGQVGQLFGSGVDRHLGEGTPRALATVGRAPRVVVVEEDQAVGAQGPARRPRLDPAALRQLGPRAPAELPRGGVHHDDAVALGAQAGDGPAREDRLVVGVCVEEEEGRHPVQA